MILTEEVDFDSTTSPDAKTILQYLNFNYSSHSHQKQCKLCLVNSKYLSDTLNSCSHVL